MQRATLEFAEREYRRKLGSLRSACESLIPDLEGTLAGQAHYHQHDDGREPETPYVRESPQVGRNYP